MSGPLQQLAFGEDNAAREKVVAALVDLLVRVAVNRQVINLTADSIARLLLIQFARYEQDSDLATFIDKLEKLSPTNLKRNK